MIKYSIITPQFNSFDLMGEYFKSLESQKFKDFEVIIVDDCSTDGSYEKLKDYVDKSKLNIKLFQSEKNLGPGNARNIGLDHAHGEWITFVDNDDWVDSAFLEDVDRVINENDVNAIIYDYYGSLDGKLSLNHSMYIPIEGEKTASECVISLRNHTIGKFYKYSCCNNLRYPKIRRCEDVAYVTQAIVMCEKAYYLMKPLYYYRQRPTSLSNQKNLDEREMIEAFGILEKNIGNKYRKELDEKAVTDLLYGVVLMMCKAGKSSKEIRDYIINFENKHRNWHKAKIIKYLGLPKRLFLTCVKYRFILGVRGISYIHTKMISKGS